MQTLVVASLLASSFIFYPSAGDRIGPAPPLLPADIRIEATIDKGPIIELIVGCRRGTAILSYSKAERLFCGPRARCGPALASVARKSCG